MVFNSNNNVFKIVKIITFEEGVDFSLPTFTNPDQPNTYFANTSSSKAHGLGYTPAFTAYAGLTTVKRAIPYTVTLSLGAFGGYQHTDYVVEVDSTDVTLTIDGSAYSPSTALSGLIDAGSTGLDVVVYLLQESIPTP
jgi:hypothetical protein